MPLPEGRELAQPWPPEALKPANDKMAEWAAWWGGDVEKLTRTYNGYTEQRPRTRGDGVAGRAARWFWGTPTARGELRTKVHVPVAADIASASSDLLFGEALEVTDGPTKPTDVQRARLDAILEGNSWHSTLLEGGDVCAGVGGVYLRTTWDKDLTDHPISNVVHGDAGVPEFRWGRLWAVTFTQVVDRNGSKVVRWLERHERGRILHGLYEGTNDRLGRLIPLTESPVTREIEVDAGGGLDTGHPGLTAAYVPNMRPNKIWRQLPACADLGRSDLSEITPLLDAIDETMSSWMRDIRLGKGRILVPQQMLEASTIRGRARMLNLDQEVFYGMNMMLADEAPVGQQLTYQQFQIRAAEHDQTLRRLLQQAFRSAGYSAATFGVADEGGDETATGVNAREKRSAQTREKKTRYWTDALRQHLAALVAVDQHVFQGPGLWLPAVSFPAFAQPGMAELSGSIQQLRAAQAMSIETAVRLLHPDWEDLDVDKEVAKIMTEQKASQPVLPDPFADRPGEDPDGEPPPEAQE